MCPPHSCVQVMAAERALSTAWTAAKRRLAAAAAAFADDQAPPHPLQSFYPIGSYLGMESACVELELSSAAVHHASRKPRSPQKHCSNPCAASAAICGPLRCHRWHPPGLQPAVTEPPASPKQIAVWPNECNCASSGCARALQHMGRRA